MTAAAKVPTTERCKVAGVLVPFIDRNRCEGKKDCVEICPYGVFEMGIVPTEERTKLSLKGKIKGWAHGYRQAFAVRAANCHACGLCVTACPEKAIKLGRPDPST